MWVNCISGVSFLCFRSRAVFVSTAGRDAPVETINIWSARLLFIKRRWKLLRGRGAEPGRGATRDMITGGCGAEFKCSQLFFTRVYHRVLATRGTQQTALCLIKRSFQDKSLFKTLNMSCYLRTTVVECVINHFNCIYTAYKGQTGEGIDKRDSGSRCNQGWGGIFVCCCRSRPSPPDYSYLEQAEIKDSGVDFTEISHTGAFSILLTLRFASSEAERIESKNGVIAFSFFPFFSPLPFARFQPKSVLLFFPAGRRLHFRV